MQKAIMDADAVNSYIDIHKKLKIPFTITLSTYTTKIQSNYCDIYFIRNEQSSKVFSAYAKVKKDVSQYQVKKINVNRLNYFSHNFGFNDFYTDLIYNIDIKSAYATILYNDGFITKNTFNYLKSIPKMDRLASVGMLASKKQVFEMDESGRPVSEKTIVSPLSDYFFHCVKRTSEIMHVASKHLGDAFLFTWVDGIYFLQNNEVASKTAGRIFKEYFADVHNLKSEFEILRNFNVIGHPDYWNCEYIKDEKKKVINIPRIDNKIVNKITEHLLTKSYEND